MREAVIAILVAAFVVLWTRLTLRNIFHQPLLWRKNFLGEEVAGSAGLAFVGSAVLGWLLLCWRGFVDWHEGGQLMFASLWFGSLGLLDDLAGDEGAKGWRGHLMAFFRQRKVTTGFIKLVGGGVGAIFLSAWLFSVNVSPSLPRLSANWLLLLIFGAVLIALSANTLNLLDVRPSRALKGFLGTDLRWFARFGWRRLVVFAALVGGNCCLRSRRFSASSDDGRCWLKPIGGVLRCLGLEPLDVAFVRYRNG